MRWQYTRLWKSRCGLPKVFHTLHGAIRLHGIDGLICGCIVGCVVQHHGGKEDAAHERKRNDPTENECMHRCGGKEIHKQHPVTPTDAAEVSPESSLTSYEKRPG